MALLSEYTSQVRRLLHDPNASFYAASDVTGYINEARKRVAREARAIRLLLSGGTITGFLNIVGGNGYSPQTTITFTGSGQQAFATPVIGGGVITGINLITGGFGFLTPPTVVITDTGGGVGASATAVVDNSASTVTGQEIVFYSVLNTLAQLTPGVRTILGVQGIASQWGAGNTYKPTLRRMVWSEFQAKLRIFSNSQVNFPSVWSEYAQGANGSFYLFPIPSQQMSMDIDSYCLPVNLANDSTPDAIPDPWTDAVQFYAAYMAFNNSQRTADADRMEKYYKSELMTVRANVDGEFIVDEYADEY